MKQYTYQIPRTVRTSTKIPILNEQGETIFLLRKIPHKFFALMVHIFGRGSLPFCYKITNENDKELYTLDCVFPGVGNTLIDHASSQTLPINSYRVQLFETGYQFTTYYHDFHFEKDARETGILKCDDEVVATVSMKPDFSVFGEPKLNPMIIRSTTPEYASLAAVLYQTFYYNVG